VSSFKESAVSSIDGSIAANEAIGLNTLYGAIGMPFF
jgi:hypothetical protein